MKKLLALFLLLFLPAPAQAGVPCSVPFTLTNGSIADATQVMANYNAIIACLTNAASAGANADITSLTGLTTPLTPAFGGSTVYVGGTSIGNNTITLANPVPNGFSLTAGVQIKFMAGGTNLGGATTLNVNSTGAKNVFRQTVNGAVQLGGAEIVGGTWTAAEYDGTEFILLTNYNPGVIGSIIDYAGAGGCPVGYNEAEGSNAISAVTYPTINTILGTTWGTTGGNANVPDFRGRATFERDFNSSARITIAGGNFDGTLVGNTGGQQSQLLTTAQLPALTFTGTAHTWNLDQSGTFVQKTMGFTVAPSSGAIFGDTQTTPTVTITPAGTIATGGLPHPVLSNAAIVLKCVKL